MATKQTVRTSDTRMIRRYAAICFGLPAMTVLLAFIIGGFVPFGDTTLFSMDLHSQYFPMITSLRDALREGDLFYSFSAGLGFDRLSQSAYYTNSIFWYVLALLPASWLIPAFHLTVVVKIGLGGLTFSHYLYRRYGERSLLGVALSTAYGLSSYVLAYIQQVMWMDAVILLPVVMLGLWLLLEEKRPLLYYVSLSLLLISNFYVGFGACIFTALQFVVWELSEPRALWARLHRTGQFLCYSLLSGGTSAVWLIPTLRTIGQTKADGMGFEGPLQLYHSLREVVESLLPFTRPELGYGVPNIYCGVFVLPSVILYAACRRISLRRKLLHLLLLAFLLLSFELNLLDYIWHGFHYPNQLPGRQSFVFVFLALALTYEALAARSQKRWTILLSVGLPVVLYLGLRIGGEGENTALLIGALLLVLYGAVLLLFDSKRTSLVALAALMILEIVVNAAFTLGAHTRTFGYEPYTAYDATMEELTEKYESGTEDLWRTESFPYLGFNSGQLYGHKGVSYYSSMMSSGTYDFLRAAGFGIYGENVSAIYTPTPVINALLNVRYVYERDGRAPLSSLHALETQGAITVKENQYYLPFAFIVDPSMADLTPEQEENALVFQNRWLKATGGTQSDVFVPLSGEATVTNAVVHMSADGKRYYQREDTAQPVVCEFAYTVDTSGEHYLTSDFRGGGMEVWINGRHAFTVDTFYQRTACLGTLEAGDRVELRITGTYDYALYGAELYRFREDVMSDAYEALLPGGATVTRFRSGRIDATVTAEQDGLLYITLLYNGGWHLTVDGQRTELSSVAGFLTCAPIEAGEHTLVLRYTPLGFGLGLTLTLVSVAVALLPFAVRYIKKKRTALCAAKDVK